MFRFLVTVCLLATVCFAENPLASIHKTGNYLEDGQAIESHFKDVLKTGIPEWKLPVMEPYHIAGPVKVDLPEYKVEVISTDLKIEGISSAHSTKFGLEPKTNKGFHDYELTNVKVTGHSKKIYKVEPEVVVEHEFSIVFPKLEFSVVKTVDLANKKDTLDHFDAKISAAPVFEIADALKKALADHPELVSIADQSKSNANDYFAKTFKPIFLKVSEALAEYYKRSLS